MATMEQAIKNWPAASDLWGKKVSQAGGYTRYEPWTVNPVGGHWWEVNPLLAARNQGAVAKSMARVQRMNELLAKRKELIDLRNSLSPNDFIGRWLIDQEMAKLSRAKAEITPTGVKVTTPMLRTKDVERLTRALGTPGYEQLARRFRRQIPQIPAWMRPFIDVTMAPASTGFTMPRLGGLGQRLKRRATKLPESEYTTATEPRVMGGYALRPLSAQAEPTTAQLAQMQHYLGWTQAGQPRDITTYLERMAEMPKWWERYQRQAQKLFPTGSLPQTQWLSARR